VDTAGSSSGVGRLCARKPASCLGLGLFPILLLDFKHIQVSPYPLWSGLEFASHPNDIATRDLEDRMSNAVPRPTPISVDDYLDGETRTEIKHEYLDGDVVAMGGTSAKHGLVMTGLGLAIGQHARRKGCQLFIADMKVRVEHTGQTYFY